ncbi:hypothetical protein [Cellulomonas sp. SLBN-39]|uniref:hypothetical protein n=1 Tax=Cellulomonas sp. SLBN-39 TaxID=2768446 RepID=UPI00114EF57A|nr:hypothetical protein [Cellulomonas sp. SLBN-39]TQL01368.1 hypothetical protein FBY24_0416 [Cellulomonas sp. SLBN-39]
MGWRVRLLAARVRDQPGALLGVLAVMLLATTLLGTFAQLLTLVGTPAVASELDRLDPRTTALDVRVRMGRADPDEALATAGAVVDDLVGPLPSTRTTWVTGRIQTLPSTASGRVALGYAASTPAVPGHARLLAGDWPTQARDDDGHLLVAAPASAAEAHGWEVGDVVAVQARDSARTDAWRVVGVYEATGPASAWSRDLLGGAGHDPAFPAPGTFGGLITDAWGPFVVVPGALTGAGTVDSASLVVQPTFAQAAPGALAGLRQRLPDAQVALTASMGDSGAGAVLTTRLGGAVEAASRELAVTRVGVVVVGLLLTLVATTVVLLGARLLGERRTGEDELLVARGAAPAQLRTVAVVEAGVLAAVVAAAAPLLVAAVSRAGSGVGSLQRAGLVATGAPSATVWLTCAGAAALLAAGLVVPAWRSAGASRHAHAGLVRAGADVALLALGAVGVAQLLQHGPAVGAGAPDVVLVVAPALVALAAAVLAVRLVGPLAAGADVVARRARGLVAPWAAWQVARRPGSAAGATVLLVLGATVLSFTLTFGATWRTSQLEQADLTVGTDVRGASGLADAVARSQEVAAAAVAVGAPVPVPVVDRDVRMARAESGDRGQSARQVRLLAMPLTDPDALLRGRTEDGWAAATADVRPADRDALRAGVPLPAGATWLSARVQVGSTPSAEGSGELHVVVEDARGVRASLPSALPRLTGAHDVRVTLPGTDDGLRVVGLTTHLRLEETGATDGSAGAPAGDLVVVQMTVGQVRAGTDDGTTGDEDVDLGGTTWSGTVAAEGLPRSTAQAAPGGLRVTLPVSRMQAAADGSVLGVATGPEVELLPVAVTQRLRTEGDVQEGDLLHLEVGGVGVQAVVATVLPWAPGAPHTPAVLVDRDGLQHAAAAAGTGDALVDAWWGPADASTAPALAAALVQAGLDDVVTRADARTQALEGPLRVGVPAALVLVLGATGVLLLVGLANDAAVGVRVRRLELARLQALGLGRGAVVVALLLERTLLLVVGLGAGVAAGLGLGRLLGPVLTVSADGGPPVPDARVDWAWGTQLPVLLTVAVACTLVVVVVCAVLVRRTSGALLRMGDR